MLGVFRVSLDTQPAHDFQQTGVVGESQFLRGLGDVPLVSLESLDDDLALSFLLLLFKRELCAVRRTAPRPSRISGGTALRVSPSPSVAISIRSTTLRSSRMLLRRQS